MTLTVETGDAAGAGHIMEPLLSALGALTDTLQVVRERGRMREVKMQSLLVLTRPRSSVVTAPLTRLMFLSSSSTGREAR